MTKEVAIKDLKARIENANIRLDCNLSELERGYWNGVFNAYTNALELIYELTSLD